MLVTKMPDFDLHESQKKFWSEYKPIIWEKAQLLSFNEIKPWDEESPGAQFVERFEKSL